MRINREELLRGLETASAGLAKREIIEQSNCFVFHEGKVLTFNDEVAISMDTVLAVEGAVEAEPLLALLRKLTEEDLEVDVADGGLLVCGKGRRATVHMEESILLPIEVIEEPGKWRPMPEGLGDALRVAVSCCSTDESHFLLTCVHVDKDCVEAGDDFQIIHYPIETRIKKATLLRRDAVSKLTAVDPTEWSESENWLHFRNPAGLMLSCRRYMEAYPNIRKHLDVEGDEVAFPKGIEDALDKAQIFSAEDPVGNQVSVSLTPGKLRLEGRGPSGWYREQKKVKYNGSSLAFRIEPRLLVEISRRSDKCVVGDGRIKVDAGRFTYVSCTALVEE